MADNLKTLFSIEIDASKAQSQLDATEKAISKVRDRQKELNEQLDAGVISQKDYDKESQKCVSQLEKLEEQHKKVTKAVADENSIMGKATSTAKNLGGAGGQAVGQMTSAVGGLSNAFKALVANPVIAVATVLIGLFMKLKDAIANNEELQNRLNVVMSAFEPIGNAIANIFDKVAGFIVSCAEGIANFIPKIEKAVVKVMEFISKFTPLGQILKAFGVDLGKTADNMVKNAQKQRSITQQLTKDEQALIKAQQKFAEQSAENQSKIADIQDELADKESLSYEQRMAKTKELAELRRKDLAEQKRLLDEELRLAEARALLAPNSAEDNKKLADLKLKVANAQRTLNAETKKGNKLIQAEAKAIESEKKAIQKQLEDARKQRLEEQKKLKEERDKYIKDITSATDDDIFQQSLVGLDEYTKAVKTIERERIKITEQLNAEIEKVEEYGNKELADKLRERLELSNKALDKQLEDARKKREAETKKAEDELVKRTQDLANKMAQAEIKGATGIDKINLELEYNKRILEQKHAQDLEQANLTKEDRLMIEQTYQMERVQLEKDADAKIEEYNKKLEQAKRAESKATLDSYKSFFTTVSTLTNNLNQLSEEGSKTQQALARVSIVLQMALSMANGISSAMEQSFPINLIAAASTVAELAVMFSKIRKVKSEQFSKGGLVGGYGSGTSDSNVQGGIAVSKGEAVINANATRMYGGLLNSINTSTGGEPIRTASNNNAFQNQLRSAIMDMPSPVVSVVDINKGQDRTNYVRTISKV